MTEWIELNDLQAVAIAKSKDWEIECKDSGGYWNSWHGRLWNSQHCYRGRPRQPVMRKVKMECWSIIGRLEWLQENTYKAGPLWVACPAQDIEIEIPENKQ